ncbi:MAG: hypothetical protein RBS39_02905 [Phycisphaerales bacterium]|jgi:hypothetical protein|nr:hypothetical protein [Phycisphaerales bacterium]
MALVYAGIDEAGYGPTLGPLTVGMCAVRVADWSPDERAPDLWARCSAGVCREAGDARGRVAVADSKALKLSNGLKTKHPLTHLERGVLAMLGAMGVVVRTDAELFASLGLAPPSGAWYAGEAVALPLAHTPEQVAIASATLARGFERGGVEISALRCEALGEDSFNAIVRERGSKSEATMACISSHLLWTLGFVRAHSEVGAAHLRCVCDRQGGRTRYGPTLKGVIGVGGEAVEGGVRVLMETERASRYAIGADEHAPVVSFQVEAEASHLPVAAASMVAKYVRELLMLRFNRYWGARIVDLKPTAGYATDARRWLRDVGTRASAEERRALVRIS